MSSDQTMTGIRKRNGKSHLNEELYRIDREKKAEMRMHNMSKQRFRARYSKLDYYTTNIGKAASDVRMYETHNPGFCYRRNGECRSLQSSSINPTISFQDIHSLLFTNGEVDIEKVLCLHLLTAHKTESLTPPTTKYHRSLSLLSKDQSPLERLLERSRKRRQPDSLTKLLPTYILDVKRKEGEDDTEKKKDEVLINDGRLAERVIINDKIGQLVHTVMAALQDTNPDKMNVFLDMAKDPETLNKIVEKPHIREFMKSLNGHVLVSSCESFHLTPPFKASTVPLELKTSTDGLEELVKHIRQNVLQFPEASTWKNMYERSQTSTIEEESSLELSESSFKAKKRKDASLSSSSESLVTVKTLPGSTKLNFVEKNKESAGRYKNRNNIGSTGSKNSANNPRIRHSGSRSSWSGSVTAVNSEERLVKNTDLFKPNNKSLAAILSEKNQDSTTSGDETDSEATSSLGLKPGSKNSKVKKPKVEQGLNNESESGTVQNASSRMVQEKIRKIHLEERRALRASRGANAGRNASHRALQAVAIDVLDLAKIGQEIKEKETQKKLEKFLETTV